MPSARAEAVEGDRVDGAGVGLVPLHLGRDLLLVDEDLGADRAAPPRPSSSQPPTRTSTIDSPASKPASTSRSCGGTGLRRLRLRIGEDVDELAAHEQLVLPERAGLEQRSTSCRCARSGCRCRARRRSAPSRGTRASPCARTGRRSSAAIVSCVRQRQRAPVAGDGGVEVHQVVAVEDDLLRVDLGPAHAQAVEEAEVGTFHGGPERRAGAPAGATVCQTAAHGPHPLHHPDPARVRRRRLLPQEMRARRHPPAAGRHRRRRARRRPARPRRRRARRHAARGVRRARRRTRPSARCAPRSRCIAREGCDGLVAVGGGSSIDLAKGVAIAATHDGPADQLRHHRRRQRAHHRAASRR